MSTLLSTNSNSLGAMCRALYPNTIVVAFQWKYDPAHNKIPLETGLDAVINLLVRETGAARKEVERAFVADLPMFVSCADEKSAWTLQRGLWGCQVDGVHIEFPTSSVHTTLPPCEHGEFLDKECRACQDDHHYESLAIRAMNVLWYKQTPETMKHLVHYYRVGSSDFF